MITGHDELISPLRSTWEYLRAVRLRRWVSPLTSRLLLVNFLPLLFMGGLLLSINEVRNTLLNDSVDSLREQARIYASVLQQAQKVDPESGEVELDTKVAHLFLDDMIRFSRNAQVRLYAPNGSLLTESARGGVLTASGTRWQPNVNVVDRIYGWVLSLIPLRTREGDVPLDNSTTSQNFGQDTGEDVHLSAREDLPPYIRQTAQHELVMTVVAPVVVNGETVGVLQLTRHNADIDRAIIKVRWVIVIMMLMSMGAAVLLSWYFAMTLSRPLRCLVVRSREMREPGQGRVDGLPYALLSRRDEIGELARTLRESALALWARMDDVERFASEVSHELKNPLSSIRSALDTLPRIADVQARDRLLGILGRDVQRLERLIADISFASRVEGELQRGGRVVVDVVALLELFVEVNQATRKEHAARLVLSIPEGEEPLNVMVGRDGLVQVLHNLIGNAKSFSPPDGIIRLAVRVMKGLPKLAEDGTIYPGGPTIEIAVEDDGPGIPPAKLDSIFERFYSERPPGENFGKHSGLGLAISRQIILAFEGTLHAENREELDPETQQSRICGARFVIRLPRFTAAALPPVPE